MKVSRAEPVEKDSRGILDPWLLHQRVRLNRYPVGPALKGLVDRFWAVTWDLPTGTAHTQQLLTHPGSNISIGYPDAPSGATVSRDIEARLNGVALNLSTRTLQQD